MSEERHSIVMTTKVNTIWKIRNDEREVCVSSARFPCLMRIPPLMSIQTVCSCKHWRKRFDLLLKFMLTFIKHLDSSLITLFQPLTRSLDILEFFFSLVPLDFF